MRGLLAFSSVLLLACSPEEGGEPESPPAVAVSTELSTRWELLDHRLSLLEIGFDAQDDQRGGVLAGQNDGGPFGAFDTAIVRQAFTLYEGKALASTEGSVLIHIPGPGSLDPDAFVAEVDARVDASKLPAEGALAAWIRGYRLSTNEYPTPPPFASDPDLPYDPAQGFTTQGVGIAVGDLRREGAEIVVPVRARHSLGAADRANMNAAAPQASSWLRVDFVVVGARGVASALSLQKIAYTLGTTEYGKNTFHPHADDTLQALEIAGEPQFASGLVGLKRFDIWINADGHIDPACVVVQDPVNFAGEPVSGPGRYLTELSARLWDVQYAADAGRASARLDLFCSNTSTVKEIGNLCLGLEGELSLLQVDAPISTREIPAFELELTSGELTEKEVRFDP